MTDTEAKRQEIKLLRLEANKMETQMLRDLGWLIAMPFDGSLDYWENTFEDGRCIIVNRHSAIQISKKFQHLFKESEPAQAI